MEGETGEKRQPESLGVGGGSAEAALYPQISIKLTAALIAQVRLSLALQQNKHLSMS